MEKKKNSNWTEDEILFVKENYEHMEAKEIAQVLGRTVNAVQVKISKLGLTKNRKSYTQEHLDYIRENYEKPNVILSKETGLHADLIKRLRREYGIPKPTQRVKYALPQLRKWDESTVDFIDKNKDQSNEWLSEQLGLSTKTIRRIRKIYNIDNPFTKNLQGQYQSTSEYAVEIMLKRLGIKYVPQYKVGNYIVDFIIGNKAIEVQGDYWHSNPTLQDNPRTERQKRAVETDWKKKRLLEHYGFDVLWVWEEEIQDGRAFMKIESFLGLSSASNKPC